MGVRILYRAGQFWRALTADPIQVDLAQARRLLSPSMMEVFLRLQPGEQAHSLWVFNQFCSQGETNHDLLVAALMHDVGKTCQSLKLWERVWIVLGKGLFQQLANKWGMMKPNVWRRPFWVSENHAAWGAEMASQAGASPLSVSMIKRHHEPFLPEYPEETIDPDLGLENRLLRRLQLFDNRR